MTDLKGHANDADKLRFQLLESKRKSGLLPGPELLELALLTLEPGHDPSKATSLLETLLQNEPNNDRCRLWLAHIRIYEFMSPSALHQAVELCDETIEHSGDTSIVAAGRLLKGAALWKLSSAEAAREQLEQSVAAEPGWVANRQLLAKLYEENGDIDAAQKQLTAALTALAKEPERKRYSNDLFELLITARGSYKIQERLADQLKKLGRPPTR